MNEHTYVTYGLNKSDLDQAACNAGNYASSGYTARALIDGGIARFIFERERINGYTIQNNTSSGRFKCQLEWGTEANGDTLLFWTCDNGGRFSSWYYAFTLVP
jgi:hypothetical protein